MGRFHIRRKEMPKGLSAQAQEIHQGSYGSTPERLMAAITGSMGEVVDSGEEFEELTALLIYKSDQWVKQVAKMRDFQAAVDRRDKNPETVL